MYRRRVVEIYASEIGEFLNLSLVGPDFIVRGPASLKNIQSQTMTYVDALTATVKEHLAGVKKVLLLVVQTDGYEIEGCSYILTPRPRLDFMRVLNEFFVERASNLIDPTARIESGAQIGRNVRVGAHSVIGPEVTLGDNTIVLNGAVINGPVTIGRNCLIKDSAIIGSEGYSFEFDENGVPVHFPYAGRIVIGDSVWIGANSTIERAELDDTVIEDFVKIDDLVQIGQSCVIGSRTMITAGSVIGATATIGKDCWLAPNVSIRDQVTIGDNVLVGVGAVVIKDLVPNGVYVGNPSRFLRGRERK